MNTIPDSINDKPLLIVGPTLDGTDRSIGGTTISLSLLIEYLGKNKVNHRVISTNRNGNIWMDAIWCLFQVIFFSPGSKLVMLNANPRGALILAPLIRLYSILLRKKYVFRMFGGDLADIYNRQSESGKKLLSFGALKADLLYVQTQSLIDFFTPLSRTIRWLPTSRRSPRKTKNGAYNNRFVYVGQIMQSKGVDHVIRLAENRPDISVTIFGPILESKYKTLQSARYYGGVLNPADVADTLIDHDVLLLPTTHKGEGYPGIIIEALHLGLPVIATRWLSIPELIMDTENGYLIEPDSYSELSDSIDKINETNYKNMSKAALASAKLFDADIVNEGLIKDLISL